MQYWNRQNKADKDGKQILISALFNSDIGKTNQQLSCQIKMANKY